MQKAMEEIRELGDVSEETAKQLAEATDEMYKFKKVTKEVAGDLVKSVGRMGRAMGEGSTDVTVFNDAIDTVTGAISKMAASLPIVGAAMVAVAEGSKFLLNQIQATTQSFNEMGDAGALGADGMSGLRDQFTDAQVTLQTFTKVVTQNSQNLAAMGGTAGDGAKQFSRIVGTLRRDMGPALLNMGVSIEKQAEQTAEYLAMQTRLGLTQTKTQSQLSMGAGEYIRQLDALSKATGMQKDAIVKQQDAALSESRFRARYDELIAQGREKEAKALLDFQTSVSKFSPELAQGLRDIASGFVNTEAAQKAYLTTQGRAGDIIRQIEGGGIGAQTGLQQLQGVVKDNLPMMQQLAKATGDATGVFANYAQMSNFAAAKISDIATILSTQAQQLSGKDGLTNAVASAQTAMQQFGTNLNILATQAMPKAAEAVKLTAETMNKGLEALSGKLGQKVEVPAQYAEGGIARGPKSGYPAELHGTEAVIPLPDGKSVPVEMQGARLNGMGMDGSYMAGGITTDTKLTDMIMKRLGLTDFDSKRMINLSGIGTNMQVGAVKMGSDMAPGVREALVDMVENLRNEGVSTQDALKATLDNFQSAMTDFLKTQSGNNNEGMVGVMMQLADLQRQQLGYSKKIAQNVTN